MSINFKRPEVSELKPRITVFGVGGAGGNAVNNMIRSKLEGVEFVIANTDAQALAQSPCERKIQMGTKVTEGLGAGSRPEVGCAAAEESLPELVDNLSDAHMVFITAGMGGGTGTGAAPVIARAARDKGILTVGVVTKPFQFEGARRMRLADEGIRELQQYVDTLIIIPNQNLFRVASERTTFAEAFAMADEVLYRGVRGITDLMVMPGLINLDFADVRTVMSEMGKAMMGTGEASGEKRAVEAAEAAISNPLLDEVSMRGAKGVLINITGGMDLTLFEVDEAANRIRSEVDPEANIIVGSTFDQELEGLMRISVVATGIANEEELDVEGGQDKVLMLKGRPEKKAWSRGTGVGAPSAGRTQTATSSSQVSHTAGEGHRDHPQHRSDAATAASHAQATAQPGTAQGAGARAAAPDPAPAAASSPTHDLVRRVSEYAGVADALGQRQPAGQSGAGVTPPATLRAAPAQAPVQTPAQSPAHAGADAATGGGAASGTAGLTNGSLAVAQAEPVRPPKSRLHDILSNLKHQVSSAQHVRAEPAAQRNEPAVEPSPRIVADAGRGPAPARTAQPELGGPSVRVPPRSYVDETMEIPTFLRRPLTK